MVIARDAATIMLVRDAPDLHICMLRRNFDSVGIAGASVFPGAGRRIVVPGHSGWIGGGVPCRT